MANEEIDVTAILRNTRSAWTGRHKETTYTDKLETREWNLIKEDPELVLVCIELNLKQNKAQRIVDDRLKLIREMGVDEYKAKLKQDELEKQMELAKSKVEYVDETPAAESEVTE